MSTGVYRLVAAENGDLASIQLNNEPLADFDALQMRIINLIGDDAGPDHAAESAEVELDCDYGLRYEHVIQAITAVSGYIDETGNVVKLVEKIKFAPPRQASGE